jgi:hypothetical protein
MAAKPALTLVKKTLRPYRLLLSSKQVKLTTNPNGSWDSEGLTLEKGWVTVGAGWILQPKEFGEAHPEYCLFSRMETQWFPNMENELVEAWLYTPTVSSFFNEKENRNLFRCYVDPACLYELPLV